MEGVWARIVARLGLRPSLSLACIAPGSSPVIIEKDSSFLLQHLAVAPGSYLTIVHSREDEAQSPRFRASVAHSNPPRLSNQPRAPPAADNPAAPPQVPANQPGLWARLSAAVDEEQQPVSDPQQPAADAQQQPAAASNPANASNPLPFPLPIPHSSSQNAFAPTSPVDRSVDLAFELETLKSDLMEERLMVEGLEMEVRRLTDERIAERNARHRLEESLDDAQAELASAMEQNGALKRELETVRAKQLEERQKADAGSCVDIVKDVTDNQVQHASLPMLNSLEIAAKDLLAKVFQVRGSCALHQSSRQSVCWMLRLH